MSEIVVDSSVLIDYLRGRRRATEYLDRLRTEGSLATHVVAVAEVLAGSRNQQEQNEIERLFEGFVVVPIEEQDSIQSVALFKEYRLAYGVGWLDCLIAATCLGHSFPIATLNDRHFAVFGGLRVIRPY
jgi:predicted nucleic acid-binding protein